MAEHRHPTDPLLADLLGIYQGAARQLEVTVRLALERGLDPENALQPGSSTAAFRLRQLKQARAIIAGLRGEVQAAAPVIIGRAYGAGVLAVDRVLGDKATARGTFGKIHQDAVRVLASNMAGSLDRAAQRVGINVETVFERAAMLDGPLTPASIAEFPLIGRRVDDPYRSAALQQIAESTVTGDTRRQMTAQLSARLQREGVTDSLTGFVDAAGRRWPIDSYSAMVSRTTTREAMTTATVQRTTENGDDLIAIPEHAHPADECTPYEGKTWSLTGKTPGYDVIDELPPFHPNCVHVVAPATATLDAWEAELARALADTEPRR